MQQRRLNEIAGVVGQKISGGGALRAFAPCRSETVSGLRQGFSAAGASFALRCLGADRRLRCGKPGLRRAGLRLNSGGGVGDDLHGEENIVLQLAQQRFAGGGRRGWRRPEEMHEAQGAKLPSSARRRRPL